MVAVTRLMVDPSGQTTKPTESCKITSHFGLRTSLFTGFHSGTDFGQKNTSGRVYAVEAGTIIRNTKDSRGTNYVLIKDNNNLIHGYFHITSERKVGDFIREGSIVGISDLSGRSFGLHLHYTLQTGESFSSRFNQENYFKENSPKDFNSTSNVFNCGIDNVINFFTGE